MEAKNPNAAVEGSYGETACAPLRHPLRARILEVCNERDISPVQFVHDDLFPPGITFKTHQNALSHVSYHFRELEKAGCIELVASIQRRGATEHVYRGTARLFFSDEEFAAIPREQREALTRITFQGMIARVDSAIGAGTFDARTDRHLTWVPLGLDARGWIDFVARLASCFEDVEQIRVDAGLRLQESGETPIPATFGMLGFESPPRPSPASEDPVAD